MEISDCCNSTKQKKKKKEMINDQQSVISSTPESQAAEEKELHDFQTDTEEAQTKPETPGRKLVHFSAKVKEIVACREEDLGSYSDESESGETRKLRTLIKEAEAEFRDLNIENEVLQKRLLAVIKRRPTFDTELSMEGVEYQYWIYLKKWNEAKEELHILQDDYDEEIDKAEDLLQDKQEERNNLHNEFSNYKWQVAREAKHRTSKKHLSRNFLEQLQLGESKIDEEIEKLRLELRRLSIELRHNQRAIARKDKLPNGLSTTDFEHLRSLNVSLSTKGGLVLILVWLIGSIVVSKPGTRPSPLILFPLRELKSWTSPRVEVIAGRLQV